LTKNDSDIDINFTSYGYKIRITIRRISARFLDFGEIMMYVKSSRSLPRLWLFFFFEGSHIEIDMRFTSRGRRPFKVRQVSRERASD